MTPEKVYGWLKLKNIRNIYFYDARRKNVLKECLARQDSLAENKVLYDDLNIEFALLVNKYAT